MKINVNGEDREVAAGTATVRALLAEMRYSFPLIVVRVNGRHVERADYESAAVAEGDHVDIYHLVSGG
jgi:sulfur carrier protein